MIYRLQVADHSLVVSVTARSDVDRPTPQQAVIAFQSTRPARGATAVVGQLVGVKVISIHAPREGRDVLQILRAAHEKISIHAPREGRDGYGSGSV